MNSENKTCAEMLLEVLSGVGGGLQEIADVGRAYLGNPVAITDKSWKVIVVSAGQDGTDDAQLREMLEKGMLSPESVNEGLREDLAGKIERAEAPFLWQGGHATYPRMLGCVQIGGKAVATVSVICSEKPLGPDASQAVYQICQAVAAGMQKDERKRYTRGLVYEDFISTLLDRRIRDPQVIKDRIRLLGLDIRKYLVMFAADIRDIDSGRHAVSYMRDRIEELISGGRALIYEDRIVVAASFTKPDTPDAGDLEALVACLKRHGIHCGVSLRFTEPVEIRFRYEQAVAALQIGQHLESARHIYPYSDYAVFHQAMACAAAGSIRPFLHQGLVQLLDYDAHYETSFAESLRTWLRCARSTSAAAQELHIHRNTVLYHLGKASELAGVSLADSTALEHIESSFRLLEYDGLLPYRRTTPDIPETLQQRSSPCGY